MGMVKIRLHLTSKTIKTTPQYVLAFNTLQVGEMIRIVDDLYGYAPGNRCSHRTEDCVVHAAGQRSIVTQICSSKTQCRDLIITRHHCRDTVTSYQQITYECVPSE